MRVNERTEAIALYGGETDEKDYLNREFDQVLSMMRRLVSAITRLTWVTAGYGWFAIVAPFIVAAPGYFAGDMSLGGLMMAVGAFNQVQQALRWFVDNFSTIADWRATLLRVASFRLALLEMDSSAARQAASSLFRRPTTGSCSTKSASPRPPVARGSARSMS